MTYTLIDPEMEYLLQEEASMIGIPVADFILTVLQERVARRRPVQKMSMVEFDHLLDELSSGTENLPPAPPGAFSRGSFYNV